MAILRTLELRDGTRAVLRHVRPADKPLFLEGLRGLSPLGRYFRFFMDKEHFSEAELAYLTEVDGSDHVAIGVVTDASDGHVQPIGVARFIRLRTRPHTAEIAITIVDRYQGQGVGVALLEELSRAARERGVTRFECTVLPENAKMRDLVHFMSDDVSARYDGVQFVYDMAVPTEDWPPTNPGPTKPAPA